MRFYTGLLFCIALIFSGFHSSKAQTIELLAGNTLNGAVNGTLLGGATMALTGETDFRPLQAGLGLGTLYGLGMGAYDITTGGGHPVLVSGLFNDGDNTSIIILLDTFYGAAAGTIIATSVMLVADEPIIDGLKYGSSVGAWVGFGVGLIDVFMFSERMTPTASNHSLPRQTADGLVAVHLNNKASVGLVSPAIYGTYQNNANGLGLTREINPGVNLLNLKFRF